MGKGLPMSWHPHVSEGDRGGRGPLAAPGTPRSGPRGLGSLGMPGQGKGSAHGVSLAGRARATTSNRWKKCAGKESPVPARLLHLR